MRRLFKQDFSRVDDTGKMMEPSQVQRKHKCCPQILLYSGVVGALLVLLFMLTVGGAIGASTVSHTRSLKLENSSLLALGGGISVNRGVMAHPGFGLEVPLLLACRGGVSGYLGTVAHDWGLGLEVSSLLPWGGGIGESLGPLAHDWGLRLDTFSLLAWGGGMSGGASVASAHGRGLELKNSSLSALGGGISVHRGVMAHPGFGLEIPLLLARRGGV